MCIIVFLFYEWIIKKYLLKNKNCDILFYTCILYLPNTHSIYNFITFYMQFIWERAFKEQLRNVRIKELLYFYTVVNGYGYEPLYFVLYNYFVWSLINEN